MKRSDETLFEHLRKVLDTGAENMDARTVTRLAQIRRNAMSRRDFRTKLIPRFAPAIAFATSAIMLAILLRVSDGSLPVLDPDLVIFEFVLAESDLELIEDLEFYRWLDANGNAG